VPEPVAPKRDWLRPLLGAGTCFLLLRVALWFLIPVVQFFGGEMMAITLGTLLAAAAASALAMAIFESRRMSDLGLAWGTGAERNLMLGTALGAAGAMLVILPPIALGMAHFAWVPNADISWRAALFLPILLFCGAMGEEIAFRGFVLQYLMRGWTPWIAILATGVLFGWLHNGNPSATFLSDINTALFGILFGWALLRSHDLWLPIGLHFGWNCALPFLGVEVSGLTIRVAGYELLWKAGNLWSGGKYGPEASILTSAVLVILFLVVWKVPVHKGWAYLLEPGGQPPGRGESVEPGSLPAA
jgi:membrane protease YdiL (CAAX protease family)